ncbi:hypothetical protein BH10PSE12_BH10PSE12_37440 [soil metagenome]
MIRIVIPTGWLVGFLTAWLGLTQLLLWRFLDVMPPWAYPAGMLVLAAIVWGIVRTTRPGAADAPSTPGPTVSTLLLCVLVSLTLFVLAGEGRFFYSNVDWQVRDAVLRDMAVNPWPFVYTARGAPDVLRAPLGLYFLPALGFKLAGSRAADLTMLLQNTVLLSTLLALGSGVFANRRQKLIALVIVIFFSGLDIVGQLALRGFLVEHLEFWSGLQFSSNVTLAFWVPMHALSGWIGAVMFLLWRSERISLGALLAVQPLLALLSPLALIGSLPFAAYAAATALWKRQIGAETILLPALATLFAVPTMLYLGSANHEVGIRLYDVGLLRFVVFQAIEVLPFLIPVLWAAIRTRTDVGPLLVVAATLMVVPFIQIGWTIDVMMRASITPLALLSVYVAKRLFQPGDGTLDVAKVWLIICLLLGSVTGLFEIRRAFIRPPSPWGHCSFFKAWDQTFFMYPKGSYLAPLAEMPAMVKPANPTRISPVEPASCWSGLWKRPTGLGS